MGCLTFPMLLLVFFSECAEIHVGLASAAIVQGLDQALMVLESD